MKQLERIEWRNKLPDHNCKCAVCNGGQAEFVARFNNWQLPVCPDCSELSEIKLMEMITQH